MDWILKWLIVAGVLLAIALLSQVVGGAGRITDEGPKEPPRFLGDI